MAYTIDDLEADIKRINEKLAAIRADRGKRYGKPDDTLANVRRADPKRGWRGAYVSAVECMNRLENMFDMAEIPEKDFDNAVSDLINYAYYIRILGGKESNGRTD